jgi:hypothetical protein
MMSDPNHTGNGQPRPQVIDLDAEEISSDEPARRPEAEQAADDATPPPAERKGRSGLLWVLTALILGLLAGGWIYRSVLAEYLPSNQVAAMQVRLAAVESGSSGLAATLDTLKQQAGNAGKAADTALAAAKSAADGVAGLAARLDTLDQRVAAAEGELQSARADLSQFRSALASTPGAPQSGGVDTAALAALGQRIDTLEKDLASLKAATGSGKDTASVTSALSQALSDLKAKVAAGTSYQAEYERIARMVPAAAGLETLGARAAEGLPNAQGLTAELKAAIPALPQPQAPAAEDTSYFGTLMKSLSGIITIRDIGETDWPGVAERAAAFAGSGDLNQAISVIDAAEGEKPMALTQWRDRAAARLQLEAALAQTSDAVLRQIAALGGPQP